MPIQSVLGAQPQSLAWDALARKRRRSQAAAEALSTLALGRTRVLLGELM